MKKGMIVGLTLLAVSLGLFVCGLVLILACYEITGTCPYATPAYYLFAAATLPLILGITIMLMGSLRGFEWIAERARKRDVGFWALCVVLLALVLLAHTRGIGYELGRCVVPEFREVALNWIFWWPFHAVGLGSFCGIGLGAIPLYTVSVLWWVLFSFAIARITMYILPKLRGIE